MGVYTIVDAPFPSTVFKASTNNLFVVGLFIWLSEKLEREMTLRYGNIKAEVILISRFGHYDYHIALLFPEWSENDNFDQDEIYDEAAAIMVRIISSTSLDRYLKYYDVNSKRIASKAAEIVKTEGD